MTNAETTVRAFIEAINIGDVERVTALMSEDHLFVDSLGNRMQGRKRMAEGWSRYFAMFPDYVVIVDEMIASGDVVGVFGSTTGTYAVDGQLLKENFT